MKWTFVNIFKYSKSITKICTVILWIIYQWIIVFFTASNKIIQAFYFTCNNVVKKILRTSDRNRFRIVLFGNLIPIKNNLRTKINCEEYF